MKRASITPTVAVIIVMVSAACALGFLLYVGCLVAGRCSQNYTSEIVELGICLQETEYSPQLSVSLPPGAIYYCGKISGNTRRPGFMYLFRNGKVVYNESFSEYPGTFIKEIPPEYTSIPGKYELSIGYARTTLERVKFEIR